MAKVGRKPVDITGKRSGSVTAIRPDGVDSSGLTLWLCRCDCGKEIHRRTNHINQQIAKSCGCENARSKTHGFTARDNPLYGIHKIWREMIRRTVDPKVKGYPDYGGRGIAVCQRWTESFEAFVADMGPRPSPKHSVNRKDNDGDYCPENCEWATKKVQARNTRKNVFVIAFGRTQTVSAWSEEYGVPGVTIQARMSRGWSTEDAVRRQTDKRHGGTIGPQTAFGRTQSAAAWAKEYGMQLSTLLLRLKHGATLETALTRPLRGRIQ